MASPEEWRCRRQNGSGWRCKRSCMDGKTLCAHHYTQKKAKSVKGIRNLGGRRDCKGGISADRPSNTRLEGSSEGFKTDEDRFPPRVDSSVSKGEISIGKEVSTSESDKETNKGKKMALLSNIRDVKDLEDCRSQPQFSDVRRPVAPVYDTMKLRTGDICCTDDNLSMKLYKRKNNATITSEKQKRSRLVAHVSSCNEECLMKPSSVDGNVSSTAKEKGKRYFVVTEDDDLSLAKAIPDECFDSNIRVEIPRHEIPPEGPGPLTQNVMHTATTMRRSSHMIAEATSAVAAVSQEKYNKPDTNSPHIASFSLSKCMEEMKKYSYIPVPKQLKAINELQKESWRETFLCMSEDVRKAWIEKFE